MAISPELLTRSKLTGYVAILDDEFSNPDKSNLDMDNIILRNKADDAIKDMVMRCYKANLIPKELVGPKAFYIANVTFRSKSVVEGGKMAKYVDESPTGEIVYHAESFGDYIEKNAMQYQCIAKFPRQMRYLPLDGSISVRQEVLVHYEIYEDEMSKAHFSDIKHQHSIFANSSRSDPSTYSMLEDFLKTFSFKKE